MNADILQDYRPYIVQEYKDKGISAADAERRALLTLQVAEYISNLIQPGQGGGADLAQRGGTI